MNLKFYDVQCLLLMITTIISIYRARRSDIVPAGHNEHENLQ